MSNEITVKVQSMIGGLEKDFISMAGCDESKFKEESLLAFQQLAKGLDSSNERTKKGAEYKLSLAQNNPLALKFSILGVASLGLTFEPSRGEAYLVPRDGQIALNIGYRGLLKIAKSEGVIKWCKAVIVRENDVFEWLSEWEKPVHKYDPFFSNKERGNIRGVYCAYDENGTMLYSSMSIQSVYDIRDRSDSYKNEKARPYSPWTTFPEEMIKKTMIRRVAKEWQSSGVKFNEALSILNTNEGIEFKEDAIEVISQITPEQHNSITELLVKMDKKEDPSFFDYVSRVVKRDILVLEDLNTKEADTLLIQLRQFTNKE